MNKHSLKHVGLSLAALAIATIAVPAYAQTLDTPPVDDEVLSTVPIVKPKAGNLDPFAGNIDPFAGNIDPFGGNIDPFGGNIDPFAGNLDPFGGNLDPFGGNIDPFAGTTPLSTATVSAFWSQFATGWKATASTLASLKAAPTGAAQRQAFATNLNALVTSSAQFWGERVTHKTGQTFRAGFADKLFAKYGVSLDDPASFAALTDSQRNRLAFDWYDGLMDFAGIDHVDRWMSQVRWNPTLTKIQGGGARSLIGIIDSNLGAEISNSGNLTSSTGYMTDVNGHGAGVASLILAPSDRKGVQGIAPGARVVTFNPFDATGTASWQAIRAGIVDLKNRGASVINLSLGVAGWTFNPDWRPVFASRSVKNASGTPVFVIAAGNDGATQTANVPWYNTNSPALLLVGSVDANNQISSFSNRPGTACFVTISGACNAGAKLADRFLVAPGELILVSDGNGGTTRVTGTSFAAPLVSGAITLLHDRWKWLAQRPNETADIILNTARDLGAPGVDAVYGHGLLDVEAAQSPLNYANLQYTQYDDKGNPGQAKAIGQIRAERATGNWNANGVFFAAIETIGATYRDFSVPVSTRLIGQKTSVSGSSEYFQSYLTDEFDNWLQQGVGFTDSASLAVPNKAGWHFAYTSTRPSAVAQRAGFNSLPRTAFRVSDPTGRFSLSTGQGEGARFLGGQKAFGLSSDYDTSHGGVNPMLGFASGGAFVNASYGFAPDTSVSVGYTGRRLAQRNNLALTEAERQQFRGVEDYRANALNIRVQHNVASGISVSVDYTKLREKNGLLGVQSIDESDLRRGSSSDTATFGANVDLPAKITLAVSATAGRSKTAKGQTLSSDGAVTSSAYAMAVSKQGVFGRRDTLRVTVAQPLHIEKGNLAFATLGVVNRETGELGRVDQSFDISNKGRRLTGELKYAMPVSKKGEFSLFGRADYTTNPENGRNIDDMVIGGRLRLAF